MNYREVLGYDDFQLMIKIDNRGKDRFGEGEYGFGTCCDYVDSIIYDGDRYGVVVCVEPCGNLCKWAKTVRECLEWWDAVFSSQPEDWDYCKAGWHLYQYRWDNIEFPEEVSDVWLEKE